MHPSVRSAWRAFNAPLEGDAIPYMYLDIKRLVTTGTGNLIDPISAALRLPWTIDGRTATQAEIASDWNTVKALADHRKHHREAAKLARCRLSAQALDDLMYGKLDENYAYLKATYFPDIAIYPADAQMAMLSLAWAVGPGWPKKFPKTALAVRARDWVFAAREGKIDAKDNPGVIPRNHANERCFLNAAVVDGVGDHAKLHWPTSAAVPVCQGCGRPL